MMTDADTLVIKTEGAELADSTSQYTVLTGDGPAIKKFKTEVVEFTDSNNQNSAIKKYGDGMQSGFVKLEDKKTLLPFDSINKTNVANDDMEISLTKAELSVGMSKCFNKLSELVKVKQTNPTSVDSGQDKTVQGLINTSSMVSISSNTTDETETNTSSTFNPLKRKRTRPPKRKRKHKFNRVLNNHPKVDVVDDMSENTSTDGQKTDVEYCLTVSNLPNSWSFMDIKNYIDTECGPVDEIEMIVDDETSKGAIRLSYQTEEECNGAVEKLRDKQIEGNKLVMEVTVVSLESDSEIQITEPETTDATKKPWMPDMDSWEVDLQGMYGLKLQFLKSLGITPPLDKWVHVSNFRCDKSELRDVMDMAGNVQMCSVFTTANRYANVMYGHPLEAVQAVSMLNNQTFYGQRLKVTMDRSPGGTVLLPKGLSGIGRGLGLNGKPLKNILKHYERFVVNKDCLIDPSAFDIPENHSLKITAGYDTKFVVKSVEDFYYTEAKDAVGDVVGNAVGNAVEPVKPVKSETQVPVHAPKPVPVRLPAHIAAQPTPAPVVTPIRTNFAKHPHRPAFTANFRVSPFAGPVINGPAMQGPSLPLVQAGPTRPQPYPGLAGPPRPPNQFVRPFSGSIQSPRPGWGHPVPMVHGPRPGPMFPNESAKLLLSNLPPSTTFPILCEKMSEWGHVVCIQLTTPGCAVVTFANRMQADACFQHFNGRNIDNYFIQVQYA